MYEYIHICKLLADSGFYIGVPWAYIYTYIYINIYMYEYIHICKLLADSGFYIGVPWSRC